MDLTKKRKGFLINLFYVASIAGLFYLFIKFAFWPLLPILIAFTLAIALQKPVDKISNKFKIRKGIVSTVIVLLVIAIIALFISLVGIKVVNEFKSFINFITVRLQDPDWIERTIRSAYGILPSFVQNLAGDSVENFLISMREIFKNGGTASDVATSRLGSLNLSSILSPSIAGVWYTAKQIPSILIAMLVTVISCCFMTADYERITNIIKGMFPQEKRYLFSKTKRILITSLGKLLKAYAVIVLITFTEILLGLTVMRILGVYNSNYIFVIAILTAVLDILPIFGTGTILIPWAVYELISGCNGFGFGLILLYVVITIIRQIIEPKLIATQLDLPPALTICAMYIGLQIFGFAGMFLLPITLFCVKLLNDEGIINLRKSSVPKMKSKVPGFKHTKDLN